MVIRTGQVDLKEFRIKTGDLDRRVSLERNTPAQDSYGQPIAVWARIGKVRWARYRPIWGYERFGGDQYVAQEQVEWLVRWANDLETLNPKDRVVYPVTSTGTVAATSVFDIMAVLEVGRREGLRIMTVRRAEQ